MVWCSLLDLNRCTISIWSRTLFWLGFASHYSFTSKQWTPSVNGKHRKKIIVQQPQHEYVSIATCQDQWKLQQSTVTSGNYSKWYILYLNQVFGYQQQMRIAFRSPLPMVKYMHWGEELLAILLYVVLHRGNANSSHCTCMHNLCERQYCWHCKSSCWKLWSLRSYLFLKGKDVIQAEFDAETRIKRSKSHEQKIEERRERERQRWLEERDKRRKQKALQANNNTIQLSSLDHFEKKEGPSGVRTIGPSDFQDHHISSSREVEFSGKETGVFAVHQTSFDDSSWF